MSAALAAEAPADAAHLAVRGVSKRFGHARVLEGLSISVARGEFLSLLGPSGCGKTTLLRLVAGLLTPDGGQILVGGQDITRLPAHRRNVGVVFQNYALFPHLTVAENVGFGLRAQGVAKSAIAGRVQEALDLVRMRDHAGKAVTALSGGQQQRVAVARALVLRPKVLLFDEPLSNLDARLRRRVREDIRDLQQRLGLSVVYVTHDQQEALAVSDLVVVMRDGRIAQLGTPSDLYDAPADAFVADFMGEANLVEGEVLSAPGGAARIVVAGIEVPTSMRAHAAGPSTLAVRPESISLLPAAQAVGGLPGRVLRAAFLGQSREYEVDTAAGTLFVVAPASAPAFAVGDAVLCCLDRVIAIGG